MTTTRHRTVMIGALMLFATAAGCSRDEPCLPLAVVTDIDETLTTSDGEWFMQLMDEEHDPAMRPDANTLMSWYADNGYAVFYVTARGEELLLPDYTPAREATQAWLEAHGFPYEEGALYLAQGSYVTGEEAVVYKAGVIAELEEEGWGMAYAYGNADTDIEAFLQAGIPSDRIFLVGELAGTMDVVPLPDEEAYTQHIEDHLPTVPQVACELE